MQMVREFYTPGQREQLSQLSARSPSWGPKDLVEVGCKVWTRWDPPNALDALKASGASYSNEEASAVCDRFAANQSAGRTGRRSNTNQSSIRFVSNVPTTAATVVEIEEELRRLGAVEPSAWIREVCDAPTPKGTRL